MIVEDFKKWHESNAYQLQALNLNITKVYENKKESIVYDGEHPNFLFSYSIRKTGFIDMDVLRISDGESCFNISLMIDKSIDPQIVMNIFLAYFDN